LEPKVQFFYGFSLVQLYHQENIICLYQPECHSGVFCLVQLEHCRHGMFNP